jgi:hypothetical protein
LRLLDVLKNTGWRSRETEELWRLHDRLRGLSGKIANRREEIIRRVAAEVVPDSCDERLFALFRDLVSELLTFEGLFLIPPKSPPSPQSTAETWETLKLLRRQLSALEDPNTQERITGILVHLIGAILPDHLPPQGGDTAPSLSAPLISLLPYPAAAIEGATRRAAV